MIELVKLLVWCERRRGRNTMSESDEDASPEELAEIMHFLITKSPPHQALLVAKDCKTITTAAAVDELLPGALLEFNVANSVVVAMASGNKVILCEAAQVDEAHFIEPVARKVVGVNHSTQSVDEADVRDATDAEMGQAAEHGAVLAQVQAYVDRQYMDGRAACGVYGTEGGLAVVISGSYEKLSPSQLAGSWVTTVDVALSGSSATLSGSVRIVSHYFESGNIQLESDKTFASLDAAYTDSASLAAAVAKYVVENETAMTDALDDLYEGLNTQTIKEMRMTLPITRERFDWMKGDLAASIAKDDWTKKSGPK